MQQQPDKPQTFDSEEVLQRRDDHAAEEIAKDEKERELASFKLRALEQAEKELLRDRPEEAARREAARRKLCRDNYLPFVMRFNPDYQPGWVHKDICKRLEKFSEDVALKRSPRLMLTMPPRHGKSTLTSKGFGAWHLGRYPTHEFMSCSYSGSLSMSFSRQVRQILRDPSYHSLFDTRLDKDSQGAEEWMTAQGGQFTSAGIGGAITGKGAHILNIDDPVKNREDAESETARQNAWDWYTSTAYTRLAPGAGIILILTRWHDDDMAGRLLEAMKKGADQWELVNYPAVATEDETYRFKGDALHTDRYDRKALTRIEKNVGARDWAALYMQNPVPDDGNYFKRSELCFYDYYDENALPQDGMVNYGAWDLAIGQKQQNDFSVGGIAGIDRDEDIWLRHVERGKWQTFDLVEKMLDMHEKYRPERTGVEKGMIEMTMKPYFDRRKAERRLWDFAYVELKPGKQDKVARARAIQGMSQARKVHIPYNAPWSDAFISELLRFPNGVHDDQVDMFAWLGQMVMLMNPMPKPEEKKPSWKDKLPNLTNISGKHKSAMSA